MKEIIERLKDCIKRNRPMLVRPEDAEEILIELGIRL
jgi:hypothetical protein